VRTAAGHCHQRHSAGSRRARRAHGRSRFSRHIDIAQLRPFPNNLTFDRLAPFFEFFQLREMIHDAGGGPPIFGWLSRR
jgi:hypothetical protein